MKKAVCMILALVILLSSSVANAATNFSSMSDAQLKEQIDLIRNELVKRGYIAAKKTIICDNKGVQFYINGDMYLEKQYSWDEYYSLYIPVVCVNDSSYTIGVVVKDASVNGWSIDSSNDIHTVPVGKKAKGNLIFELDDAEVETMDDFSDVEFVFQIYNDSTYYDLFITKPITIYAEK